MPRTSIALGCAAIVAVAAVATRARGPDPAGPAPAPVAPPPAAGAVVPSPSAVPTGPDDPRATLAELDDARARAFAAPIRADVRAWAVPTCACYDADRARLGDLARRGHALLGVRLDVMSVTLVERTGGSLVLDVVDRVPPFDEVVASGRVVHRWPGRGARRWRVALQLTNGGWRHAEVRPA